MHILRLLHTTPNRIFNCATGQVTSHVLNNPRFVINVLEPKCSNPNPNPNPNLNPNAYPNPDPNPKSNPNPNANAKPDPNPSPNPHLNPNPGERTL